MLWPNFIYLQIAPKSNVTIGDLPKWLQLVIIIGPILAFLGTVVNLCLASKVFSFTRRKNITDRNIKWFQELIYTPNKDLIRDYYASLHKLKDKLPILGNLTEELRLELMTIVKYQRNLIVSEFIDLIKPIAFNTYQDIFKNIDELTDSLIKTFDNDNLNWGNPKTTEKELIQTITLSKNRMMISLFRYSG